MDRESVLSKSRAENRFGDEREQENRRKGQSFSLMVTSAVCILLILSNIWVGEDASDIAAVLWASLGAYMGWRGYAEKNRACISAAVLGAGASLFCLVRFFMAAL